ncbi:MAG TPA: alpha/beta hydrolase [Verrucomicrobiae bacterium]|nr:alpha/beta hydrolase [Verrucomicrobiae bacterium]
MNSQSRILIAFLLLLAFFPWLPALQAAGAYTEFDGGKSAWREGFERHDYVMDEATLAITPFKAPEGEGFAVREPEKGHRRCVVIVPRKAALGYPWSWRGCYWDHQPQTEVELLRQGFHIAYISANATLKPGKEWDAWYQFLTEKHGLSEKPGFIGMSRGGEYAYVWATLHPDKVSYIYADNPGGNPEMLARLGGLATNDVPLLHVCGSIDPLLGRFAQVIENIYQQLGGRITSMIKEGAGHHPHSLRDPAPIVDWILRNTRPNEERAPDFAGNKLVSTSFYSSENSYRNYPKEGTFITCRGPGFVECYHRYRFELAGVEGAITVIAPKEPAAGKPWIFRSDLVRRDATVDLALLAAGFHIVTGPVPYNADGPSLAHWNAVYEHLTSHGFSTKPVMEGCGGAAGDGFAWAIENAGKVSCIYVENPMLRSRMSRIGLLSALDPLAKAGVPVLTFSGSLDPAFETDTHPLERRYQEIGGRIRVMVNEGVGHYPIAPADPKPVVDFILSNTR